MPQVAYIVLRGSLTRAACSLRRSTSGQYRWTVSPLRDALDSVRFRLTPRPPRNGQLTGEGGPQERARHEPPTDADRPAPWRRSGSVDPPAPIRGRTHPSPTTHTDRGPRVVCSSVRHCTTRKLTVAVTDSRSYELCPGCGGYTAAGHAHLPPAVPPDIVRPLSDLPPPFGPWGRSPAGTSAPFARAPPSWWLDPLGRTPGPNAPTPRPPAG